MFLQLKKGLCNLEVCLWVVFLRSKRHLVSVVWQSPICFLVRHGYELFSECRDCDSLQFKKLNRLKNLNECFIEKQFNLQQNLQMTFTFICKFCWRLNCFLWNIRLNFLIDWVFYGLFISFLAVSNRGPASIESTFAARTPPRSIRLTLDSSGSRRFRALSPSPPTTGASRSTSKFPPTSENQKTNSRLQYFILFCVSIIRSVLKIFLYH